MMKKISAILATVLFTVSVFAQTPQKMSYQAVIRNSSNTLIASTAVGMRVSILQGTATGTEVYKEIYNPNPITNANGLASLEIGSGIPLTGTFAAINWASGLYFIKTETDPTGGTNYTITGTSQLLSVPYALFAANVNSYNAGTGVSIAGNTITNSAPDQTVAITGTGHSIVSGTYPNFTINTSNYTAGTGVSIAGNTITNVAPDQTVNIAGTGHSTVTGSYPNFTVNTPDYTAGTGISIIGNAIANTAPDQTIAIAGTGGINITGTYPNFSIAAPVIIAGMVTGAYYSASINTGTGFTVSSISAGTGQYRITFTTPFSSTPTIIANTAANSGTGYNSVVLAVVTGVSTTHFDVTTMASGSQVYGLDFSFIAVGH